MTNETVLRSKVPHDKVGFSLLDYLSTRFRYQTAENWEKLILQGKVTVNGKSAKPKQALGKGAIVSYSVVLKEPWVDTNIQIAHEEETFLIAFKPGQLPSHSDGNYIKNTFIHLLNEHLSAKGWNGKAHLVHRLDRETSGIMVVAKEKKALANLVQQFEKGTVEKEYLAIIKGIPPGENWEISGALANDSESRISIRQKVVPETTPGSKPALTRFRKLKAVGPYTLIECLPKTGRTNQIRVHLASTNNPILGDKLYGRTDDQFLDFVHSVKKGTNPSDLPDLEAPRQFLHASRITFSHPLTAQRLSFTAPLPQDMEQFIRKQNQ